MNATRRPIFPGITLYRVAPSTIHPIAGRETPSIATTDMRGRYDEYDLKERRLLRFFGINFAWSDYTHATPAASGAPVGILHSFWIYTERHAYGRGQVVDFAKIDRLELRVTTDDSCANFAGIVSESGSYEFRPEIQRPGYTVEMRIWNRNTCEARGYFTFLGARPPIATQRQPSSSDSMKFIIEAGKQKTLRPIVAPLTTLTHLVYGTEAGFVKRRERIYGRPEWLA